MPAAARAIFKSLEWDTTAAIVRSRHVTAAMQAAHTAAHHSTAQSAIDTLCLLTYSDEDDTCLQAPSAQPVFAGSRLAAAAAAAAAGPAQHASRAAAAFAALSSDGFGSDSELPQVMETLCMLSYDEEA